MYRYAIRLKLLGIICFIIACKPMPKPNLSSTKDLDQTLVNTPEPTEAECLQYHNLWSQFHPKGIANPALAVVDLKGNPVNYQQLKVWLSFCPLSAAQTEVMRSMHSTFHHRMMHLAWHQIRSRWNSTSFASIQQRITSEFPELALSAENLESGPLYGVDFLWMHGTMFHELNESLKYAGLPPIVGWKVLPRSTSSLFPPRVANEDSWQALSEWEVLYQSDTFITGTLTLGDYGKTIESTIHNLMHGYYAAARRHRINMPLLATESEISQVDSLHMQYDPSRPNDLEDYLSSPIGSAVNPTFWKLHGWIDDRIQDYLKLHPEVCFTTTDAAKATVPAGFPICDTAPTATTEIAAQTTAQTPTTPTAPTAPTAPAAPATPATPVTPATTTSTSTTQTTKERQVIDVSKLYVIHASSFMSLNGSQGLGSRPANLSEAEKRMLVADADNLFPVDTTARLQTDGTFTIPLSGGKKKKFDISSINNKRQLINNIRNNTFQQPVNP